MPFSEKIQVIVACEFSLFRHGIKSMIEKANDIIIIGEAKGINDIFNILNKNTPQIILININLEPESLNSLCNNIHSKHPHLPILLFIEKSMKISLAELIISGARGVIWKDNSDDDLIEIIRCVASGSLYFKDPDNCRINCHLSNKTCNDLKEIVLSSKLSVREFEILKFIAIGLSYLEIGNRLYISKRTVESHKNNILAKLNLKNKNELVRYAIDNFNM